MIHDWTSSKEDEPYDEQILLIMKLKWTFYKSYKLNYEKLSLVLETKVEICQKETDWE